MTVKQPGEFFDNAHQVGCSKWVFASRCIEPNIAPFEVEQYTLRQAVYEPSTYTGINWMCPECGGSVMFVIDYPNPFAPYNSSVLWCPECWLLFYDTKIGELDENGDFIPNE